MNAMESRKEMGGNLEAYVAYRCVACILLASLLAFERLALGVSSAIPSDERIPQARVTDVLSSIPRAGPMPSLTTINLNVTSNNLDS